MDDDRQGTLTDEQWLAFHRGMARVAREFAYFGDAIMDGAREIRRIGIWYGLLPRKYRRQHGMTRRRKRALIATLRR